MICYASYTSNRRNLAALLRAGWRVLVSPVSSGRPAEGIAYALDNGAWSAFMKGRDFDQDAYERFLDEVATRLVEPDWLVLPDIVAGGIGSLGLSLRYLNRCLAVSPLVLIAVQDGMTTADLAPYVGPRVGIFLGGSTEWKLARMAEWGRFCAERSVYYHVARVNTTRRMYQAIAAGADSVDGSSVSRYAVNLPKLNAASRQSDLWAAA